MASFPPSSRTGARYREAVRALLAPRSVAVVGASPTGPGHAAVQNLVASGYAGRIGCVNPRHAAVAGIPCAAAVGDLGFVPEAVVLAVGHGRVTSLLDQAADAGTRAAVVFAFDTGGDDGWQERIVETARASEMAVLGPNCQGTINLIEGVSLYMSSVRAAPAGHVALIAQSGSVLTGLLNNRRGVRFSHAVSTGNEAVTDATDLLEAFVDDPAVAVICAYLETIRRPEAFLTQCDRAHDAGKPVIVHQAGRTPRGQAAAVAHTGAMALPERLVAAALRRRRVAVVDSLDELLETAKAMQASVRPRGGAVAAITGSGGHIELLEDEIDGLALTLPAFSPATRGRLRELLAPFLEPSNPIDWWGTAEWEQRVPAIVDAAADDAGVDIVLEVDDFAAGFVSNPDRGADSLRRAVQAPGDERALRALIDPAGGAPSPADVDTALAAGVPLLSGMRDGLRALSHLVELSRPTPPHRARPADGVARMAAGGAELQDGVNAGAEALALVAAAGLDVARTVPAATAAEAVEVADALGYPVVVKLADRAVAHKTERGGVVVGLGTATDVRTAAARLLREHDAIVIQEQIGGGIELIAGLRRHPSLGSFVVVGIGGVWTEVLDDVAIRSAGLRHGEAREMLGGLRGAALLSGARGSPRADIGAAAAALEAIDDLGTALGPSVTELEINPLIVTATRAVAVDALIVRPAPGTGEPDGASELSMSL